MSTADQIQNSHKIAFVELCETDQTCCSASPCRCKLYGKPCCNCAEWLFAFVPSHASVSIRRRVKILAAKSTTLHKAVYLWLQLPMHDQLLDAPRWGYRHFTQMCQEELRCNWPRSAWSYLCSNCKTRDIVILLDLSSTEANPRREYLMAYASCCIYLNFDSRCDNNRTFLQVNCTTLLIQPIASPLRRCTALVIDRHSTQRYQPTTGRAVREELAAQSEWCRLIMPWVLHNTALYRIWPSVGMMEGVRLLRSLWGCGQGHGLYACQWADTRWLWRTVSKFANMTGQSPTTQGPGGVQCLGDGATP